MRIAIALIVAAAGFARAARGDPPLAFELDIACYRKEFGGPQLMFPPAWYYVDRKSFFFPPGSNDAAADALLKAAFEGDRRALDTARARGAAATLTVNTKGELGSDASTATAEAQVAKYEEGRLASEKAYPEGSMLRMVRRAQMPPRRPPREELAFSTFGRPPDSSSVLMWAVVGAKHQWCMQELAKAPPWPGLPAVKQLLSHGANPAFEDIIGRSPVAFAISALDPGAPAIAQREELARVLIGSLPKSTPRSTLTRWLILAAMRGDVPIANMLVEKGADTTDDEIIWQASIHGNDAVAKVLSARGGHLILNDTPEVRQRFEMGLRSANPRVVEVAVKNGAGDLLAATARETRSGSNFMAYNVANPSVLRFLSQAGVKCGGSLYVLEHGKEQMDPATYEESKAILAQDPSCDPSMPGSGKGTR